MPEECTVSSCSTKPSSWWDLHHANFIFPRYHINPNNPNSSCEDDISIFTNASNHSGVSTDQSSHCLVDQSSSSNKLLREHAYTYNHLLSHALFADLHDTAKYFGEHLIDPLAAKVSSTCTFSPAGHNYPKKMDNNINSNWGYTNQFRRDFNDQGLVQSKRLNKLSNMVGNWSTALPNPEINHQFDPQTCDISLCPTIDLYRQNMDDSTCYGHDLKVKNEEFCYNLQSSIIGTHYDVNGSMIKADSQYISGVPRSPCTSSRSFLDIQLTRPLTNINFKPALKSFNLSKLNKKELEATSLTKKVPGIITNEGKKKMSEDMSDEVSKKAKNGTFDISPVKESKATLRDRITTLQQIVSPFGKTDTASVLQETFTYINFLHEQVKLLSHPYMKSSHKDPWRGWDREGNKRDSRYSDLKSRGLCLVPISCTLLVYRENTGSDYWNPTYRGCFN